MSVRGLTPDMNRMPRQISVRECDFAELRRALDELVGERVGVEVSALSGSAPFITAIGRLGEIRGLGAEGRSSIAFDIGDVTVRIAEWAFVGGWREEYVDAAERMRWRLVVVELRFGVVVEIEEIPAGEGERT